MMAPTVPTCRYALRSPSILTSGSRAICTFLFFLVIICAHSAYAANVTSVTTSTPNGSYKIGDQVTILVSFSEAVTVTDTPRLTLETGASDAVVSYTSGSGTNTLTFVYTIASGHTSNDLDYQSQTALSENGGSIQNVATGMSAGLTLPSPGASGSLGANAAITVDTTAPSVTPSLLTPSITNSLPIRVQFSFSETVTGFDASDITVTNGTVTALSGGGASYTADITASAHGTVTMSVPVGVAFDQANNGNTASSTITVQYDIQAPTVTNITSSPSTGSYRATQSVNVIVTFSEAVTVAGGAPSISLATGPMSANATLISGSGTTRLTFRYTISTGDSSEDLDYTSTNALVLNGSTVRDAAGNGAILTLPDPGAASSLSSNSNVVIDTTLPSVEISSPLAGDTDLDVIPVTVVFSEAVTGFALSDFTVTNGCASNLRGSGTTYYADIVPRTNGSVSVAIPANIAIDRAGNGNSAAPSLVTVNFNTAAPRVTTVTSSTANGAYRAGQTVSIQVSFSEAVVVSGTPQLRLATGSVATVDYLSGSGTDTITFLYTITAGQNSADLDYIPLPPLSLNGGFIRDAATESLAAAHTFACPGAVGSLAHSKNIVIDTIAPTISRVTSTTPNGSYRAGQTLNLQTQFSEIVYVTGTPLLTLETGQSDAVISLTSGSGTTNLNFNYTIQDGHNSSRLDYQSVNAFGLNGAIIQDLAGNIALVNLPATGSANSLFGQKNLVVDTIPPTVPNVSSTNEHGSYRAGTSINVRLTLSEVVYVTGSPRIQLATGLPNRFATFTSGSASNTLNFTYSVVSGDTTSDLDYVSSSALDLNGGSIRDLAGNDAIQSLATPGAAFSLSFNKDIQLDTTAPTIVSVASTLADGTYRAGTVVPIRVTFSEAVSVAGSPTLLLNTSPSQESAVYSSGTGSNTLTFLYTIGANQNSLDLDYVSTAALSVPAGSSIRDPALNEAVVTLPAPGLPGSLGFASNIAIDTQSPTVTGVTSTIANGSYRAGSLVEVLVTFSENIFFTGQGSIELATGPLPGSAQCTGLLAANTLRCTYTIAAGDTSADLDYRSTSSLTLGAVGASLVDAAGNAANLTLPSPGALGSLGFAKNIILDTAVPSVTLSSTTSNDTNVTAIPVSIVFSEPVTGLSLAAFVAVDGTVQNLSGSGAAYTVEFVPADQGSLSLTLSGGAVLDTAGNANSTSNTLTRNFDSIRPTVTISSSLPERSNAAALPITITFNEAVSGFDASDISLTNGSVASFSGSGATYSVSITPGADGIVTFSIAENVAVDIAQNGNQASTTLSRTIDTTAPLITSVSSIIADGAYAQGAEIILQVVFNEPIQLSGSYSLQLATGTGAALALCSLISSSTTLECSYTVTAGDNSPDLDYISPTALVATDSTSTLSDRAGNTASLTLPVPGETGSLSDNKDLIVDTSLPSATLSSSAASTTNTAPIEVSVNFSEPVTGLTESSFVVANGSINVLSGSGSTYVVQVRPDAQGTFSIELLANGARDQAGNACTASAKLVRIFDSIRSEVIIDGNFEQTSNNRVIPVSIQFSEPVTGFQAADLVVTHGSVQAFTGSGSSYSAEILADEDGSVEIFIPENVAFDGAGNGNLASEESIQLVDTTPATILAVTSSTPNGYYKAGSVLMILLELSEPVSISGSPRLMLQTGRENAYASHKSGGGSRFLTFEYVVAAGDNSTDLDYLNSQALVLEDGSISDMALNPLANTLPTPGSFGSLAGAKDIVIDTLAPSEPIITSPLPEETLSSRTVTVSGSSEPGATVRISTPENAALCSTVADQDGDWNCIFSRPKDGRYTIQAQADDLAGNQSVARGVSFIIDAVVPVPPVFTDPTNGVRTAPRPRFSGTAPPGMTVYVQQEDGTTLCTASVDSQGIWSCTGSAPFGVGNYQIKAITEDPDDLARSLPTSLTLSIGAQASGIVLMANRTKDPLPGVTISDGVNAVQTSTDGTYSLATVELGNTKETASKPGWRITKAASGEISAAGAQPGTIWYAVPALEPESYAVWDGRSPRFSPSLRILNRSTGSHTVHVTLHQADGTQCSDTLSALTKPLSYESIQLDQSPCFTTNSFGLVRVNYPSQEYDGDLMMRRGTGADRDLTSVFSLPLANSVTGKSHVFVDNAYHKERGGERTYIMRNELTISNLAATEKRFTIRRYRSNAVLSRSQSVVIAPLGSAMIEFPDLDEQKQENGIQEIEPEDLTTPYIAVLTRRGEQQLDAPPMTGRFLFMDYSRSGGAQNQFARVRYLPKRFAVQYAEIANVSTVGTNVRISRLTRGGRVRPTIGLYLRPAETRKIRLSRLLDPYQEGVADISSDVPSSIIVNSIMKHYRGDRKLLSMKTLSIKETFGDTFYGMYQKMRGTRALLKITNIGPQPVQGSITCYQGSQAMDVQQYALRPGGQDEWFLEGCFGGALRGVVELNASIPGAVVADTLLFRRQEDVHLPGRLR